MKDKMYISGNITSLMLNKKGIGISEYYYGEFFYSYELLINDRDSNKFFYTVNWDLEGITRTFQNGLTERVTILDDIMLYELENFKGVLRGQINSYDSMVFKNSERSLELTSQNMNLNLVSSVPMSLELKENSVIYSLKVNGKLKLILGEGSDLAKLGKLDYKDLASLRKKRIETLLAKIKRNNEFYNYCWYVLLTNKAVVKNHPVLKYPFTMPSKYMFRHQWLWDSSFHAIVLTYYDLNEAKGELMNLFLAQKEDGRIPHEIFLSKRLCKLFWGIDDYSPWTTQPPVIAIAVEKILSNEWDEEFAKIAYNALVKYDQWFKAKRDLDNDSLYSYHDPLESGWDDSVRWDEAKRRYTNDLSNKGKELNMYPVEAVDLNCFIYKQKEILSWLSERLGYTDKANKFSEEALRLKEDIIKVMWDDKTGFFYDVYDGSHEKIFVKTPAAFTCMFSKVVNAYQATRLLTHILNPSEFWTTFPIPSVSADDKNYDPAGYWRGRSWLNMIWLTYHGLKNYGFDREASILAKKVIQIMEKSFSCNENYNSKTGEPLGAVDFGWTTLIIDLMIREGLI